jgi:Leucine-rich repeat (LRR) protein
LPGNLQNNNLTAVTAELEELNLSCNELETVPESITHFASLQVLHLANTRICDVSNLVSLRNLKELDISNLHMDTPPDGIKSLSQLTILKIHDQPATVIQMLAKFVIEKHDFRSVEEDNTNDITNFLI